MEYKGFKIVFGKERLITPGGLAIAGQLLKRIDLRRRLNQLGKPKAYKHRNYECVVSVKPDGHRKIATEALQ